MLEAMREIEAGRVADEVNFDPGIEGGQAATTSRPVLHVHEFGEFRVLVAAH
jgi:hypothetical protein